MKKTIVLLATLFFAMTNSFASDEKLSFTSSADGSYVDFVLHGERIYTAFQIDQLTLPEGYSLDTTDSSVLESAFVWPIDEEEGGIVPYTDGRSGKSYTHSLGVSESADGSYRLSLTSNNNDLFTAKEGVVLRMYVRKNSSVTTESEIMKATGICFITTENNATKYSFPDASYELNPNADNISYVSILTAGTDDIYTLSGVSVNKMLKDHVYIVGGRKVLNK